MAKNQDSSDVEKLVKDVKQDVSEGVAVPEESEFVSKKKVIYAEIDDEVTTLYDRIKPVGSKHIYVVIPKRAILFQSVVNLKILKRKALDDGRKIYFITNDKKGIYLSQQIGIPVYNKANSEGNPALFSTEVNDEQLRITPLKASVNSLDEDAPTRVSERKLSISEILRNKKLGQVLNIRRMTRKKEDKQKTGPKLVISGPSRHALIGLVVISLAVLLVIVYIALPGATIYLTPAASVLEKSVNITLADYNSNRSELDTHPPHMIASYPISTKVNKTITHYATGKKFSDKGANASGTISITNTTNTAWPLVVKTRFQTDEGIVFRLTDGITVPAATSAGPGKIDAFVVADQVDAYGSIVGKRGNIEPTKFFLPGLKDDSRSKLYAENSVAMSGGVTDYISFVTSEDIEAARSRMNDELLKNAIDELKNAVKAKGELLEDGTIFTLLEGEDAIKIGETNVNVPQGLENMQISEFNVSGDVSVSGVYYDHDAMLEILQTELALKKSPQKELLRINNDSTSYRIFEWDVLSGKIKLTANIKGIEQYEIDMEKENGARLLEKIKEHIVGKNIEDAKVYIQNLPEVNKVEIDSWPAWSPTVPKLPDNIDFEVRDAMEVQ